MLTLRVDTTLSCAHKLVDCVGVSSQCRRLHGHTYYVEVYIESQTCNLVVDADIVKDVIDDAFDHRYLNDRFEELGIKGETTLENLAKGIWDLVQEACYANADVVEVVVQEGDGAAVRLNGE